MSDHVQRGQKAERLAADYLKGQGFALIDRNFKAAGAEIDLIMRQGTELHFIEVKARWTISHGHPLEQVSSYKQRRLVRAAESYLQRHPLKLKESVYLSVLGIDWSGASPQFHWIPNAFDGSR